MLNSAENEILPANKQQITDKYSCFLLSSAVCEIIYAYEYEIANIRKAEKMLCSAEKISCSAEVSMKNV